MIDVLLASSFWLFGFRGEPGIPMSEPPVQQAAAGESPRDPGLAHLPLAAEKEILAWRARLDAVGCLKVITNLDDAWFDLNMIDSTGSPSLQMRERFQIHTWMMPDRLWAVIYPYKNEQPDTTFPIYQVYWSAEKQMVWERTWSSTNKSYDVFRTKVDASANGPEREHFEARDCNFAVGTHNILTDRDRLKSGVRLDPSNQYSTMALARSPNTPIVPPDPSEAGYWFDVFSDTVERDSEPNDPERLHRRSDCMLLTRDADGLPELREWRTIITADRKGNGRLAFRVVWTNRFEYEFHAHPPEELAGVTASFVRDVDKGVDSMPKGQGE
ncbi:MAG: hypothetical protein IT434_15185 [Phycisphaerales bacterium]|nr:hypothetical protein [Phycisphaerales bacterium]